MQSLLLQQDLSGHIIWFRRNLLRWFARSGRSFPWRETTDPYAVLMAEIMLRRTKADQVVPVYQAFLSEFPTLEALRTARRDVIEDILYPLGLPERANEVIELAHTLLVRHHGRIPSDRRHLLLLPGVGEYVAGAVLSVGYHQRAWIIDANVVRVFSRYFGLALPGEARRHPTMIALARQYVQTTYPGHANLALLDHAALLCKHVQPLCPCCPVQSRCCFSSTRVSSPEKRSC
jgi:A/G-specific adenine glycosylase